MNPNNQEFLKAIIPLLQYKKLITLDKSMKQYHRKIKFLK